MGFFKFYIIVFQFCVFTVCDDFKTVFQIYVTMLTPLAFISGIRVCIFTECFVASITSNLFCIYICANSLMVAFLKCRTKCLQNVINTLVYFVYLLLVSAVFLFVLWTLLLCVHSFQMQ